MNKEIIKAIEEMSDRIDNLESQKMPENIKKYILDLCDKYEESVGMLSSNCDRIKEYFKGVE